MGNENNLTASQRAQLFAQATRQNMQMLPSQSVSGGGSTMSFTLPKARLLSKIMLDVEATVNIKHASKTVLPDTDDFTPYRLIRRLSLDLNNGFAPFVLGGGHVAMLNLIQRGNAGYVKEAMQSVNLDASWNVDGQNNYGYWTPQQASPSGVDNKLRFTIELPVTTNDRDPISLILLQNESTNVSLVLDICNGLDMFNGSTDGYTVDIKNVTVTPLVESFSIPANSQAMPDISVLKLTHSRTDDFTGAGQHIIKLNTGTIYRRLLFRILDENNIPIEDEDLLGNIEIVFNQADIPYSMKPRLLRMINTTQYGFKLPKGMYVFDFAYQGIAGMGGTRDLIDTERLTEFWLRFTTQNSGHIELVTETLSRLQ